MAQQQQQPHFCPNCGASVMAEQRVCASCGLHLSTRVSGTQHSPLQAPQPQAPSGPAAFLPQQYQNPAGQTKRRQGLWKVGCVLVLFLVLAALGILYVGAPMLGLHLPTPGNASQPPITTVSLNTSFVYAGMNVTLINVQRADSFRDDSTTSSPGVLRIQVRAQNTTQVPTNLLYTTSASLVLPGGKTEKPSYVSADVGLPLGVTRTSLLDFAVPTETTLAQILFRLGSSHEAQMDIPLVVHPDLAKYDPKTTMLASQLQYVGLDWTLTSATVQWSIDGVQAAKGMRYVNLQVKVNNTLSQTVITGSAYDYVRLMAGTTTLTPVATTLPVSFAAATTAQTGSVTFLVPQDAKTFTFILVTSNQSGFNQATTTIQLS